jgi:hypothetical protein
MKAGSNDFSRDYLTMIKVGSVSMILTFICLLLHSRQTIQLSLTRGQTRRLNANDMGMLSFVPDVVVNFG